MCLASALLGVCAVAQPSNIPLNDLGPGSYMGFQGGLYPGGLNAVPPAHWAAAMSAARQIVPRDVSGNPDPNGWIVVFSVGMSNTTHEFSPFERQEDLNVSRNGRVIIFNGALGGQTAAAISNPNAAYWQTVANRLAALGLSAEQVQAIWLKEANANPPNNFPLHAQQLRDDLRAVAQVLHDKFSNVRICYCSSRTYGGYATGSLNPEPQAYESGFSFKWLIEEQINGDPALNFDPNRGPVESPLLLWGPYLWADGINPRSDGLIWVRSDFESDGTHPAPSGEQKVADMLSAFFGGDGTAQTWYSAKPGTTIQSVDAIADAHVSSANPNVNFGITAQLFTAGGAQTYNAYIKFDISRITRPVRFAKLNLRVAGSSSPQTHVRTAADNSWTEGGITFANAPPAGANVYSQIPQASKDGTIDADVTDAVNAAQGSFVTFVLTAPGSQGVLVSRDGGQAPRLTCTADLTTQTLPISFAVSPGIVLSGGLQQISASDDDYMVLRPGIVFSTSQPPIVMQVNGTLTSGNPNSLQFAAEAHAQQLGIIQEISAYDFVSGEFRRLSARPLLTADEGAAGGCAPPNRFIGPGNEVRVRVAYRAAAPVFSYPWRVYIDRLWWLTP